VYINKIYERGIKYMKKSSEILSTADKRLLRIKVINKVMFILLVLSIIVNCLILGGVLKV